MAREDGGNMIDLQALPDGRYEVSSWKQPTPLNSPLFNPGTPVMPVTPLERPRVFEYRPGINYVIIPRAGYGLLDFQTLRNLAFASKEIRLNIELIKREVRSLEWEIVPYRKNDKTDYSKDIDDVMAKLENPDGQHDFEEWCNQMLEEILVTDALSIYPDYVNRELHSFDILDGTKIRPILDYRGRVARPPAPGYMQVLYGQPAIPLTTDELMYWPMNASVNSPYGTSPIEYFVMTVNLALRRETFHLNYYTEGNVPEALVGAPASWQKSDIDAWQSYWDALLAGNSKQQRRLHWVPLEGSRGSVPVYEFRRDNIDMTDQDQWLMTVACWAFGNSPQEFGLTNGSGLGGKGYGDAMENVHQRSMITPITGFVSKVVTHLIRHKLGYKHLKHHWTGLDPVEDSLKQAQVDELYLQMGVYDRGYVQERDGIPEEHRPDQAPEQEQPQQFPGVDLPGDNLQKSSKEDDHVSFFRPGESWNQYP